MTTINKFTRGFLQPQYLSLAQYQSILSTSQPGQAASGRITSRKP